MSAGFNTRILLTLSTLIAVSLTAAKFPTPIAAGLAQPSIATSAEGAASRTFTNDEILVYGSDASGKKFLLDLSLNRKEQSAGEFVHYYMGSFIYGAAQGNLDDTFTSSGAGVRTNELLQQFEHVHAEDLSTQEYYRLETAFSGRSIKVWIPRLQSDFLVRNVPEYTKYVSAADATVDIDGTRFTAHALVSKINSTDYSKYVFFPGHGTLRSETDFLVLWDDANNLYVIDSSKVAEPNPAYQSHTWVLFKNGSTGATRKAFNASIALDARGGTPKRWRIAIPGIADEGMLITAAVPKAANPFEGIAEGTIAVDGKQRAISGLYFHHIYGTAEAFGA